MTQLQFFLYLIGKNSFMPREAMTHSYQVKLASQPQNIQIDGLPENVVPLTRTRKIVRCQFPNGDKIQIERDQLDILPNFAMTDYASQGKTRLVNVVHLNNCRSHQAYYTALSRSASAAGTMIVQAFATNHITGGASGWLRQEFRQLEMLDTITKLKYEGNLPEEIHRLTRNTLIHAVQKWKGLEYVPNHYHSAIRTPMKLIDVVTDSPWRIIDKSIKKFDIKKTTRFVDAVGSTPLQTSKKHDRDDDHFENDKPMKKRKILPIDDQQGLIHSVNTDPVGLKWDGPNYSCAYDAFMTILCHIWTSNMSKWSKNLVTINREYMGDLSKGFRKVFKGTASLEDIRDQIRSKLNKKKPQQFPYGEIGTDIGDLVDEIMRSNIAVSSKQLICPERNHEEPEMDSSLQYFTTCRHNTTSLLRVLEFIQ